MVDCKGNCEEFCLLQKFSSANYRRKKVLRWHKIGIILWKSSAGDSRPQDCGVDRLAPARAVLPRGVMVNAALLCHMIGNNAKNFVRNNYVLLSRPRNYK